MAKKEIKNNKDKTNFIKSFKAELKKVIWPTPKQLFNSTVAVLTIVIITAIIVFILDLAFETINKNGIDRIKQVVSNSTVNETTENETSDNEVTENETTETENEVEESVEQNTETEVENNENAETTENTTVENNTNN